MSSKFATAANDFERKTSRSIMRIRARSPFFGTLLYHTRVRPDPEAPTAYTDGKAIYVSPSFLDDLSLQQTEGILLHEVLHAALRHGPRRGSRPPRQWNVAADIVVNGIVRKENGLDIPSEGIVKPEWEDRSTEEVYELLKDEKKEQIEKEHLGGSSLEDWHEVWGDLRAGSGRNETGGIRGAGGHASPRELDAHWKQALQQAKAAAETAARGSVPAGLKRAVEEATAPQLDWRQMLWRFLARTPTDFAGYDRRFVHRGLYVETLEAKSVRVFVAVDTSGSVTGERLARFLSEVRGILRAYPRVEATLYYADVALHGPYALFSADAPIPEPEGGGGTSFVPFFEAVGEKESRFGQEVAVYLTDGYGTFPDGPPPVETLWVVTPGGLASEEFPFGKAVRLLSDEAG